VRQKRREEVKDGKLKAFLGWIGNKIDWAYQEVLKLLHYPLTTIESPTGGISSKRVYGLGCFAVAVVLAFLYRDAAAITSGAFLGAATAVFVTQAATGT
jgi:hypothetical protein